ncbi:MAG TPA: adenosylcobinamide-GDP ribazoletransferase [Candidatus Aquicultor sp.]|jgi:adenosylcobinamide-GDP ribazoletransferase
MLRAFRLALSFLSILPAGLKDEVDDRTIRGSVVFFPVVGAIIGIILLAIGWLAKNILEPLALSAVIVVALAVLTRGLHLDGLADTFDGLFGGTGKECILDIMKDSRIGSFGVVAIVAVLLLKAVILAQILGQSTWLAVLALVVFPVIGRWSACVSLGTQRYARGSGGLGESFTRLSDTRVVIATSIITLVVVGSLLLLWTVPVMLSALALTLAFNVMVGRKIGGITGDTVGAIVEINEVAALLVMAIIALVAK